MALKASGGTTYKVMLSSTFRELEEHRKAVIDAMLREKLFPNAMEHDAALADKDLIDASLYKVDDSDAYVGLISYRYGQTPSCPKRNPNKLSLTELEFRRAVKRKIPICMFLMSDQHPVPAGEVGKDHGRKKLEAFRKLASDGRIYATFDSVADLKAKAIQSLAELRALLQNEPASAFVPQSANSGIPAPPALFARPHFIPGHKFVGRTRELLLLDDWATDPNHPVLLFESIGGMGKSMLAWRWVREYASETRTDWAGKLWYSFYERGADMGDFCANALAYTTGRPLEELREYKTAALAPELIQVLHQRPWLFVLDGLERVLVAYHRFDAAQVRDEDVSTDPEKSGRSPENCIRREDDELLIKLCAAGLSKLLMSSRLMPRSLLNNSGQPLLGVRHVELKGLDPADAESMMRDRSIRGSSPRIQTYLEKNCACHPLVVGAVAGLVANYRPAPNEFDRWADDPQGGTELNIAQMELVQKRNHILEAAFNDLTLEARTLLGRVGLISDAIDLATIEALNPHRPEPPKKVDQPRDPDSDQMLRYLHERKGQDPMDARERDEIERFLGESKKRYRQQMAAYDKYRRELAAWQESSRPAVVQLEKTLNDLEARGLLQWDRGRNLYDLHPVVRGYAVSTLSLEQRSASGQKVVDYFSSRSDPPYEQASSLNDLRNGLQVVRTLLQIGRHQDAARLLSGSLAQALLYNLERFHEYLALAHPFFADGWSQPPRGLPSELTAAYFAAEVAVALLSLEMDKEATALSEYLISVATKERLVSLLLGFLCGHVRYMTPQGRLYQAKRTLMLAEELSSISGEESTRAYLELIRGRYAYNVGDLGSAEAAVRQFHALPKPPRQHYRAGEVEELLADIRLHEGRLDEELLSSGMRAAVEAKDRFEIRNFHDVRGEWLLMQRRYREAQDEFEEAIAMAREVGLACGSAEARMALARAKQGDLESGREAAQRLAGHAANWALAELYLALGDQGKAREYALKGHASACAQGTPYVYAINLQRNHAVLDAIGVPAPRVPAFDESKAEPLPFESEVRAFIEELKQKKRPAESK